MRITTPLTLAAAIFGLVAGDQPSPLANARAANATSGTFSASASSSSDIWAGANNFFLYALKDADRNQVLDAMRDANLKVLRIFVTKIGDDTKNSGGIGVSDVETGSPGQWDDMILQLIDQLMVDVHNRGMKLIITLHDRWAMGTWGTDVYAQKYGLQGNDLVGFYNNAGAAAEMDRRFAHILTHKNPHFGNRAWGDIGEAVFAVGIENESQGGVIPVNFQWVCDRATALRKYITNPSVLVASGGGREVETSLDPALMNCAALDILGVHYYGADPGSVQQHLHEAVTANKKRIYVEEFGALGQNKANDLRSQIQNIKSMGVPWIFWEVSKPGKGSSDYEVWTDEPAWQSIKSEAATPTQQVQKWPELGGSGGVAVPSKPTGKGDWQLCAASSECTNACCSKKYSNDGQLKCTPGGTGNDCIGGGDAAPVPAPAPAPPTSPGSGNPAPPPSSGLGDWLSCSSNSQCANGCCSKQYSNDGKLKCTPGGSADQCVGGGVATNASPPILGGGNAAPVTSTTLGDCMGGGSATPAPPQANGLGDWQRCSASSQCSNGCCSKQYSNDGNLKCTPGGSASQCVGGGGGSAAPPTGTGFGDWNACGASSQCSNGCCSKQYSNDYKLKCTPGGSRDQCV